MYTQYPFHFNLLHLAVVAVVVHEDPSQVDFVLSPVPAKHLHTIACPVTAVVSYHIKLRMFAHQSQIKFLTNRLPTVAFSAISYYQIFTKIVMQLYAPLSFCSKYTGLVSMLGTTVYTIHEPQLLLPELATYGY